MVPTLFSPRVSQALDYDAASKKCFQEFNQTHQLTLAKLGRLAQCYAKSERPIFQRLTEQVYILTQRVNTLARLTKEYIHEHGVCTPRRTISPRPQSLLPNIEMLRRIKLAQNLQIKILSNLEFFQPEGDKNPALADLSLKIRKFTVEEYEKVVRVEMSIIKLTMTVSEFTYQHFPWYAPTIDSFIAELDETRQNINHWGRLTASAPEVTEEDSLKKVWSERTSSSGAQTGLKNRLQASFMSRTIKSIGTPSYETQARGLYYSFQERHRRLESRLDVLCTGSNYQVLLALFGERPIFCTSLPRIFSCMEKLSSRARNIWCTTNRIKPAHKELFQLGIKGLKLCEELQSRYLISIEELIKQVLSTTDLEMVSRLAPFHTLPREFEKEFEKLNSETTPLLVNMSVVIHDAFSEKISQKVNSLLEKAEFHRDLSKLLIESDEQLFQAEIDLEEYLQRYSQNFRGSSYKEYFFKCRLLLGAYQAHEIVQEKVLNRLNSVRVLVNP